MIFAGHERGVQRTRLLHESDLAGANVRLLASEFSVCSSAVATNACLGHLPLAYATFWQLVSSGHLIFPLGDEAYVGVLRELVDRWSCDSGSRDSTFRD